MPSTSGRPVTPTVAEEDFALFWNELLKLQLMNADGKPKTAAVAGDVLHLQRSHMFGRPQELRHVYVRQSYVDLVGIIMKTAETAAPSHEDAAKRVQALIRGTPGIGKSVFLTFLLWSIIQHHRGKDISIVYRHGPTNVLALVNLSSEDVHCFVMKNDDIAPDDAVHRVVRTPNNWVLLDACIHIGGPNSVAHTVMVTSPRATLYNDYAKHCGGEKLFMPVWEWAELSDCRFKVFNVTISQQRLECVAEAAGPIPRLVFEATTLNAEDHLRTLETDVANAIPRDLAQLTRILNEVRAGETINIISHRLIHLTVADRFFSPDQPKEGYRSTNARFASPYVETQTLDYLVKAQMNEIKLLISGEIGDENLRKILYERWAHVQLPLGGQQYKIKRLDGSAPGTDEVVTFPAMRTRPFWNLMDFDEKALAVGEYAQPRITNLGAVDALVKPNILFQMTVAASHPVKASLLEDAIDAIDPLPPRLPGQQRVARAGPPIRLYFVIPQNRWATFRKQPYHSADAKPHVLQTANIPLEIRNRVQQWALLFPAE